MARYAASALAIAMVFTAAPPVLAAGYALHEYSALSAGRVHASAARLDTPETLFFNPAGLMALEGFQASAGVSLVVGNSTYSDPGGAQPDAELDLLLPVPSAAISYRFKDFVSAGLGFAAPYGLTLDWPEGWAGEGQASFVSLKVPTVYATVAFGLAENLWLAVGGQLGIAKAELERVVARNATTGDPSIEGKLDADGFGYGLSLGVMFRPSQTWYLGAFYKSRQRLVLEGEGYIGAPGAENVKAKTKLWTPDTMALAVGIAPAKRWYVELDGELQNWNMVESLKVNVGTFELDEEQDWGWSWLVKAGVEFTPVDRLTTRMGLGFERTPVPEHTLGPILPDADRILASVGVTYQLPNLPIALDASYFAVPFLKRTTTSAPFPATYTTVANWFALQVRFTGPQKREEPGG